MPVTVRFYAVVWCDWIYVSWLCRILSLGCCQILFFLMFYFVGIDQTQLIRRMTTQYVWGFAIFKVRWWAWRLPWLLIYWVLRGDLLLAIAGLSATAPLFGTGAIVNAVGFDALLAMAKTITATLVMPVSLLVILWLLGSKDAHLDFVLYIKRLLIYIIAPMILAVAARQYIPRDTLNTYYPKIAKFNIILLMMFPLGLMSGFEHNLWYQSHAGVKLVWFGHCLIVSILLFLPIFYTAALAMKTPLSALACGGRNVLLAYTIHAVYGCDVFTVDWRVPIAFVFCRYWVKKWSNGILSTAKPA